MTALGRHALQYPNTDRSIDVFAAAGVFAGASADMPETGGEDVIAPVDLVGGVVSPIGNKCDVPRDISLRRAGTLARNIVLKPLHISGGKRIVRAIATRMGWDKPGIDERQQP
jgi:hypothetical protein